MSIDWDKPYGTRDGREVLIYTMSSRIGNGEYTIRGEVKSHAGKWNESSWTSEGMWSLDGHAQEDDLVNIPPQKHTMWINVYGGEYSMSHHYADRDKANRCATGGRIACIEVTFTEGEGLE